VFDVGWVGGVSVFGKIKVREGVIILGGVGWVGMLNDSLFPLALNIPTHPTPPNMITPSLTLIFPNTLTPPTQPTSNTNITKQTIQLTKHQYFNSHALPYIIHT
jgi:hypothetical protein